MCEYLLETLPYGICHGGADQASAGRTAAEVHSVCRENAPLPDLLVVVSPSTQIIAEEKNARCTCDCAAPPYKPVPSNPDQSSDEARDPSLSDSKAATRANESSPSLQIVDSYGSASNSIACHSSKSRVSFVWNKVKEIILGQDVMPNGPVVDVMIDNPPSQISFSTPRSNSLESSCSTNNNASTHVDVGIVGLQHVVPEAPNQGSPDADIETAAAKSTLVKRAGLDDNGERRQKTLNYLFWAATAVIVLATIVMITLLCVSQDKKMTSAVFGGYVLLVATAIGVAAAAKEAGGAVILIAVMLPFVAGLFLNSKIDAFMGYA